MWAESNISSIPSVVTQAYVEGIMSRRHLNMLEGFAHKDEAAVLEFQFHE